MLIREYKNSKSESRVCIVSRFLFLLYFLGSSYGFPVPTSLTSNITLEIENAFTLNVAKNYPAYLLFLIIITS